MEETLWLTVQMFRIRACITSSLAAILSIVNSTHTRLLVWPLDILCCEVLCVLEAIRVTMCRL